ncbi:MAG: winged helix-turn-helix transcriptional regulator [Actinobacteria bacterium]|nr:winged helix-turn-helix transcriptional regulator [Actinomycetota bacterium]
MTEAQNENTPTLTESQEARASTSHRIADVEELAEKLRVLADPTRIRLIEALERNGRSTVSALTSILPVSQQSVSHQLAILRGAGVVTRHREGAWVHYELRDWTGPWLLHQLADGTTDDN